MGYWEKVAERERRKKEEEEAAAEQERKRAAAEKQDDARSSLSYWEKKAYDNIRANRGDEVVHGFELEKEEAEAPRSLSERLAARGITIEYPEEKSAKAAQPVNANTGIIGRRVDSFDRGVRNDRREQAEQEEERKRLEEAAAEAHRDELRNRPGADSYLESSQSEDIRTVRNPEWLSALRDPEEIEAELKQAESDERAYGLLGRGTDVVTGMLGLAERAGLIRKKEDAGETVQDRVNAKKTEAGERAESLRNELAETRWAGYERLRENPDFAEKSKYKRTNANWEGYNPYQAYLDEKYAEKYYPDPVYDYINGSGDAGKILEKRLTDRARLLGLTGRDFAEDEYQYTQYQDMTADERALYNYLHETGGKEAADDYLAYLRSDLYARQAKREQEEADAFAREHPALASAGTVLSAPLRGQAYGAQLGDLLGDGEIDENAPYNRTGYISSAQREAVTQRIGEKWGQWGEFAYGTGMSMLEFLLNNAVTGGAEAVSLALMGTGAAADATLNAQKRGLGETESFVLGTIAGAAEVVSEKISIEKLFGDVDWRQHPVKYILENFLFEGAEEVESDAINWLADALVSWDKSEWMEDIRNYKRENPGAGDGEAFLAAVTKRLKEGAMDFLGGAISGGLMAGGRVTADQVVKGAQKRSDRAADVAAARSAYGAAEEKRTQAQQPQETITLPTAEEAERAEAAERAESPSEARNEPEGETSAGEESGTLRFGTELETPTLTPTAEEAEREDAIRSEEENGNVTRATGIRYGIDEKTISRAERLSELTGHRIIFYEGQPRNGAVENGFTQKSTGDIYINKRAKNPFLFTFAHEFTHNLEGTAEYRSLMSHIKSRAAEQGTDWAGRRADMRELYERGTNQAVSDDYIDEEIAADWIGENLGDEKSIRDICRAEPTLAQRIRGAIDGFLVRAGNAGGIITTYEERKYRNTVRMIDQYLREAEEKAEAAAGQGAGAQTVGQQAVGTQAAAAQSTAQERAGGAVSGAAVGTTGNTGDTGIVSETENGGRMSAADEMYARAEELYEAGEISDEEYDAAQDLAAEMESTGRGIDKTTVEDEGPRGKIPEIIDRVRDRVRGRYSLAEDAGETTEREAKPAAEDDDGNVIPLSERFNAENDDIRWSLSDFQRKQQDSENFRNWFGDFENDPENASKVVGEDGRPKMMYHGTNATKEFNVFDTYGSNYGLYGTGSYFTDNPEVATSYAENKGRGKAPRVYPVYLNIRNPIDMNAPADIDRWLEALPELTDYVVDSTGNLTAETNHDWYRAMEEYMRDEEMRRWEAAEYAQDILRGMGYDGIRHIGGLNRGEGMQHDVWIVFDPEQVKSAIGNNGEFDPGNADIRRSLAEEEQKRTFADEQASNQYDLYMEVVEDPDFEEIVERAAYDGRENQLLPRERNVYQYLRDRYGAAAADAFLRVANAGRIQGADQSASENDLAGMTGADRRRAYEGAELIVQAATEGLGAAVDPSGAVYRRFIKDVGVPIVEQILREQDVTADDVLDAIGENDILSRQAAQGTIDDALRRVRGMLRYPAASNPEDRRAEHPNNLTQSEADARLERLIEQFYAPVMPAETENGGETESDVPPEVERSTKLFNASERPMDYKELKSKAYAEVRRAERQLTDSVLEAIGRKLKFGTLEYRQFRADVVRPLIESVLREETPDIGQALAGAGVDPVQAAAVTDEIMGAITTAAERLDEVRKSVMSTEENRKRREERNAELDARIPDDDAGLIRLGETYKEAQRQWTRMKAATTVSPETKELAHDIAIGKISEDDAHMQHPSGWSIVKAYADAEREFREQTAAWERYVKRLSGEWRTEADKALRDADAVNARDKKAGLQYMTETATRNVRDVFGEYADILLDTYFRPVAASEAESTRFKKEFAERVRKLKLGQKAAKGNLNSESYAVQFLGEAEDNVRVLTLMRDPDAVRDGMTVSEWQEAIDAFKAANPNMDMNKVHAAIKEFQAIYADLLTRMNGTLVRNGYLPINVRRGYFPHFTMGSDGVLAKFGQLLGIGLDSQALPTSINGLTDMFKPGKSWFSHALERTGFRTDYGAVYGFESYLKGVADVIYQTENIRKLRALATQTRYNFGDEGIKEQIKRIEMDETLDEAQKMTAIANINEKGKFQLSQFVAWLDEYTNLLANKKSKLDRGIESAFGRGIYNWMKNVEGRVAANMIAGNLGSALTNVIPLNQAASTVGTKYVLKGAYDTMTNRARGDGFAKWSDFLVNRRGVDPLVRGNLDKLSEWLSKPMNLIDDFVSETIVRGAYHKFRSQGMDMEEAMQMADETAAGLMADRSKGAMPTIFESRNPLVKLLTQFQLEVNNEWRVITKDIPKGVYRTDKDKKQAVMAVAWTLLRYFLGAYLFNDLYEKFVGRRAALDPLDLLNDAVGDFFGVKLNNTFDMLTDGVIEEGRRENPVTGIQNLRQNALEELPFIGGLLGGGRVPISSAFPDWENLENAAANENWSAGKRIETGLRELGGSLGTYMLPPFGGGLGKKILQTGENVMRGGRYKKDNEGNEQLQYPYFTGTAGETADTILKSMLLGPTATEGGKEWVEGGFQTLDAKKTSLYQTLIDEYGESERAAYEFVTSLSQTDAQGKRMTIAQSGMTEGGKAMAMERLMNSGQSTEGFKFRAAYDSGVSAEAWAALYGAMRKYDLNGNGSYTQQEIRDALDNLTVPVSFEEGAAQGLFGESMEDRRLTNTEKAVLWSAYNPTWKTANNPYSPAIGERVVERYNELKGAGE